VTEKLLALVSEGDTASAAIEKNRAEIAFQFLHGIGDGGLGDGKLTRGAGDRAHLGDGDEILELAQLEGHGDADPRQPGSDDAASRRGRAPEGTWSGAVLSRSRMLKPRSMRRLAGRWPPPRMISSTISAALRAIS
jgi:hypothetical protein